MLCCWHANSTHQSPDSDDSDDSDDLDDDDVHMSGTPFTHDVFLKKIRRATKKIKRHPRRNIRFDQIEKLREFTMPSLTSNLVPSSAPAQPGAEAPKKARKV